MVDHATGRLSTGVSLLDDALGGGVPPGSLVALSALPRAQSEPLLYAAADANPARYLSTLRPATEIRDALVATGYDATGIDIRGVDGDDVLADPEAYLDGLEANSAVVVDPTTELEQGERERYREFLDACKRGLRVTDSVGLFHCHENTPSVLRRDMTLARADIVWDVRVDTTAGSVRTGMTVTKFRGGSPVGTLDLSFGDGGVTAEARRDG